MSSPIQQTPSSSQPSTNSPISCQYCGLESTSSLAKCVATGKWFCNGKTTSSASHIITHLVKSRNSKIELHESAPLGSVPLECYHCKSSNLFLLGISHSRGRNYVIILCREPCSYNKKYKESFKTEEWEPIVTNRQILNWILTVPQDTAKMRDISYKDILQLEKLWLTNPLADSQSLQNIDQVLKSDQFVHLESTLLSYKDAQHYFESFAPLVQAEADHDKLLKSSYEHTNVSIQWGEGLNNVLARMNLPSSSIVRLTVGDELLISLSSQSVSEIFAVDNQKSLNFEDEDPNLPLWDSIGRVIDIKDSTTTLEILPKSDIIARRRAQLHGLATNCLLDKTPTHISSGYQVNYVWKPTTFQRMLFSMKTLKSKKSCVSPYIFHKLMGHTTHNDTTAFQASLNRIHITKAKPKYSIPGLPPLNPSQIEALDAVSQSGLSLIQGPPGTGKTVVSAYIVHYLCRKTKAPVLVCAPSNVAADHLAEKIHQTGLKVVRICAKSRQFEVSPVDFLQLHNQVKFLNSHSQMNKLIELKSKMGGVLRPSDQAELSKLTSSAEKDILTSANVVVCTCVTAGDHRLKRYKFPCVLVDEATHACEPEALIPILKGALQLVLVGDHCQLGPVIMNKEASKAGLNQSLFERLILLGNRPHRLLIQYRMHPALSLFPSNTFYEGTLCNGVTDKDRTDKKTNFPWPQANIPMLFYQSTTDEELSESGTSYLNRDEALKCEQLVNFLLRSGVDPTKIGIVTPYDGQRAHLSFLIQQQGKLEPELLENIEIASIDAFQGREKDYILLSCVRSNPNDEMGFLTDPRRLNVALTRARYGLILTGNPRVLSKVPLWNALLRHFQEQGCLVTGSIGKWKQSTFVIPTLDQKVQRKHYAKWLKRFLPQLQNPMNPMTSKPNSDFSSSNQTLEPQFDPSFWSTPVPPSPFRDTFLAPTLSLKNNISSDPDPVLDSVGFENILSQQQQQQQLSHPISVEHLENMIDSSSSSSHSAVQTHNLSPMTFGQIQDHFSTGLPVEPIKPLTPTTFSQGYQPSPLSVPHFSDMKYLSSSTQSWGATPKDYTHPS